MKGGNSMDQKKIGRFLKELRKEKDITQDVYKRQAHWMVLQGSRRKVAGSQ